MSRNPNSENFISINPGSGSTRALIGRNTLRPYSTRTSKGEFQDPTRRKRKTNSNPWQALCTVYIHTDMSHVMYILNGNHHSYPHIMPTEDIFRLTESLISLPKPVAQCAAGQQPYGELQREAHPVRARMHLPSRMKLHENSILNLAIYSSFSWGLLRAFRKDSNYGAVLQSQKRSSSFFEFRVFEYSFRKHSSFRAAFQSPKKKIRWNVKVRAKKSRKEFRERPRAGNVP